MDNLLDMFLGDRVGADDAAVVGLADLRLRRSRRDEAVNVCKPCTLCLGVCPRG